MKTNRKFAYICIWKWRENGVSTSVVQHQLRTNPNDPSFIFTHTHTHSHTQMTHLHTGTLFDQSIFEYRGKLQPCCNSFSKRGFNLPNLAFLYFLFKKEKTSQIFIDLMATINSIWRTSTLIKYFRFPHFAFVSMASLYFKTLSQNRIENSLLFSLLATD